MWKLCDLRSSGGKISLWEMMSSFHGYESSRPADQVYGLLGIVAQKDDATSPIGNIPVDYDKPLVDIWLDVLFESCPPWKRLKHTIHNTTKYARSMPDHGSLLDYAESRRTLKRHRVFAYIALKVVHALYVVLRNPHAESFYAMGTREFYLRCFYSEVISGMEINFEPTIQQFAAILGFSMRTNGRIPKPDMPSGWKCAAHWHTGKKRSWRGAVHVTDGWVAESVRRLPGWYMHRILEICEEHSESCGGSFLIFNMPHVSFCMIIEAANDFSSETFRLRIQDRRGAK